MAQIAADVLGVAMDSVRVEHGDTESVGYTDGSYGSRTLLVTGTAVMNAANDVLNQLKERAAFLLETDPDGIDYRDQNFFAKDDASKELNLAQVCSQSVGPMSGSIVGIGTSSGLPEAPTSAASIAEVEVDESTGRAAVKKMTVFQDPGKAINPMAVEGQVQGGAGQGIGWAMSEEYQWKDAVMRNATLLDYRIPTALDLPMIDVVLVETPNPSGPFGARGVGEACIITPISSVANAVHSATGARLFHSPFTPERIREATRARVGGGP
jgi:CO/xanthine dehydrogenase Mo-binding subunit